MTGMCEQAEEDVDVVLEPIHSEAIRALFFVIILSWWMTWPQWDAIYSGAL